jgi:hypothetical protein
MGKPSPSKIKRKIELIEAYLQDTSNISLSNQVIQYGEKDTSPLRLQEKIVGMRSRLDAMELSKFRC